MLSSASLRLSPSVASSEAWVDGSERATSKASGGKPSACVRLRPSSTNVIVVAPAGTVRICDNSVTRNSPLWRRAWPLSTVTLPVVLQAKRELVGSLTEKSPLETPNVGSVAGSELGCPITTRAGGAACGRDWLPLVVGGGGVVEPEVVEIGAAGVVTPLPVVVDGGVVTLPLERLVGDSPGAFGLTGSTMYMLVMVSV